MKPNDGRKKSEAELTKMEGDIAEEIRSIRFGSAGAATRNVKKMRTLRKTLARIKTIRRETSSPTL